MFKRNLIFIKNRGQHTWIKPSGYETGVKVYNCVARSKVPLTVRDKNSVTWYTCGPTVYDSAHIGHASCYVKLDIIQRILENYYKVNLITAMNITDVDDKIIQRSKESKTLPSELTGFYEKEFWHDMDLLKVTRPDLVLRITDYIPLTIKLIKKLIESNRAYKATDNSIYFDVENYSNYAKLQNLGEVDTEKSSIKKSNADFALWKSSKHGEPFWESEWGPGRPGWHTECAALAGALFGSKIDIHAGGIDLRFPHHENEEALACSYFTEEQWVNYWLHAGHLSLEDSIKMSKSLKNTISINRLLDMCSADVFRMMCLMSHYRSGMEFNATYVKTAEKVLANYKHFVSNCTACIEGKVNCSLNSDILFQELYKCVIDVEKSFADDFDTSSALKWIDHLTSTTNKMLFTSNESARPSLSELSSLVAVVNFVVKTFGVFGINLQHKLQSETDKTDAAEIITILNDFRSKVRVAAIENKNQGLLTLCDNVREDLKSCGIIIKDHGKSSSWLK